MSCRGFEPVCTNNELREYFSAKGLTYDSIDEGDILILCMMLQKELKKSNKAGETSVTNTNPLRRAFLAWCDYLAEGGGADGKG